MHQENRLILHSIRLGTKRTKGEHLNVFNIKAFLVMHEISYMQLANVIAKKKEKGCRYIFVKKKYLGILFFLRKIGHINWLLFQMYCRTHTHAALNLFQSLAQLCVTLLNSLKHIRKKNDSVIMKSTQISVKMLDMKNTNRLLRKNDLVLSTFCHQLQYSAHQSTLFLVVVVQLTMNVPAAFFLRVVQIYPWNV